jgi:hypothetical protein
MLNEIFMFGTVCSLQQGESQEMFW